MEIERKTARRKDKINQQRLRDRKNKRERQKEGKK
jgi:hypothetical protein